MYFELNQFPCIDANNRTCSIWYNIFRFGLFRSILYFALGSQFNSCNILHCAFLGFEETFEFDKRFRHFWSQSKSNYLAPICLHTCNNSFIVLLHNDRKSKKIWNHFDMQWNRRFVLFCNTCNDCLQDLLVMRIAYIR